jgi:ketosteroid isomerase-like protein
MVPNQPVLEGKAACAAFVSEVMAGLLKVFERRIAYLSAEVHIIGDCGFDRGSFQLTAAAADARCESAS